jgi:hypothetical protein
MHMWNRPCSKVNKSTSAKLAVTYDHVRFSVIIFCFIASIINWVCLKKTCLQLLTVETIQNNDIFPGVGYNNCLFCPCWFVVFL